MNPIYTSLDRDEVISYLGRCWPPRPGDPCLTVPADAGLTDGAATVYPREGQPGMAWWVVDSTVYQQDAGTPDEALAALLPGSVLTTVPDPHPVLDGPPPTSDASLSPTD
ncbi:hypothetical protein [Streptomyces sp. NBC_01171]|uniref:hypothetical protein n=1 Tax=Streptomyces sp. NBC_01171 TaxID=2903757 RepID=UPI0038652334|nr:hypothetical protein OG448_15250 [Streptomyces sp. NBC_01171]